LAADAGVLRLTDNSKGVAMKAFLDKVGKVLKWFGIGLVFLILELVIIGFLLMAANYFLPEGWKIGSEIFVGLASITLSITWSFLPKVRVQFAALEASVKGVVNFILMVLLGVVMFVFTCSNWNPIPGVECTVQGAKALAVLIFIAVAGSYLTYGYTAPPADVKAAKAARAG
jgi:hypothetical protein